MKQNFIQKYNVPGPRYTSYPTVPNWNANGFFLEDWCKSVKKSFDETNDSEGISLYIHLPFCESLCTFCGCHKRITKQHGVEKPYIESVLKEWDLYCELFQKKPKIKELHLGGGTPTFFDAENLAVLINGILNKAEKTKDFEFSFEAHPNNTTEKHLKTLYDLEFRRNSFGVQDYDSMVQKSINRIQSFETVKKITQLSREMGYTSISHDLVFGLPHQTLESITNTIKLTNQLKPDRIAFYSYAHVPWIKGLGQRGFNDDDLPNADLKREMYETGKNLLNQIGYVEIGMDHFALKTDSLYKAMENKTLHRNFMGYVAGKTQLMIGLGMSAIGDSWYSFAQNVKTVEEYSQLVNEGKFPVFRGHHLSNEDLEIRKHILQIMCQFKTQWQNPDNENSFINDCIKNLSELEKDGLVLMKKNGIEIPNHARAFVRNVCMAFDLYLNNKNTQNKIFSMTM